MAGGFMSGFGSAFSRSFENARERSANRADDMFKMKYADLISRRDIREKEKKADAAYVAKAKEAVKMYGLPDELWGEAYNKYRTGFDDKAVEEWATTNEFTVGETAAGVTDGSGAASADQDMTQAADSAVASQMKESGMEAPAPGGGLFGDIKAGSKSGAGLQLGGFDYGASQEEKMMGQLGEASNMSPEQVKNTLESAPEPTVVPDVSFTTKPKGKPIDFSDATSTNTAMNILQRAEETGNPELIRQAQEHVDAQLSIDALEAQAKADAEGLGYRPELGAYKTGPNQWSLLRPGKEKGTWVDAKTNQPVTPEKVFSKNEMDLLGKIGQDNAKPRQEYNEKSTKFISSVREIKNMEATVNSDPRVLGAAGWAAKKGTELARNASGLISLVTQKAKSGELPTVGEVGTLDKQAQQLQAELDSMGVPKSKTEEIMHLATKRTLLEIQAVKFAYANAASLGQQGAGVAAKEFDRFYEKALVNDPVAWKKGMQDYIVNEHATLKQIGTQINTSSTGMDEFEARTGVPAPLGKATDIDEQLAGEQDASEFVTRMLDGGVAADTNTANPNQVGGITTVTRDAAGIESYNSMPSGTVYLDDKGVKRKKP